MTDLRMFPMPRSSDVIAPIIEKARNRLTRQAESFIGDLAGSGLPSVELDQRSKIELNRIASRLVRNAFKAQAERFASR
jgi:hypothetical protein